MTSNQRGIEPPRIRERDRTGPEPVTAARLERAQSLDECRGSRQGRVLDHLRKHAHEPVLGDAAGRPPELAMVFEPVVSGFVVDVIGIE